MEVVNVNLILGNTLARGRTYVPAADWPSFREQRWKRTWEPIILKFKHLQIYASEIVMIPIAKI